MHWMNSFTLVMRSSITTLREKIQDPERMLHQLIVDMEEELERVRESVAGAIADEIQLRKQVERARQEAASWLDRATSALKRGDESMATSALEQKVQAEERFSQFEREFSKQKEQTAKLQKAVHDLDDKIRQARQKRSLLLARMARAESASRINRALDRCGSHSAFAQFSRLEQRVERAEAMSEAYDRLEGRDPESEELAEEFAKKEREQQLEREMEALKRRMHEDQ